MKKILSFMTLTVLLLMSVFPISVFASGKGAEYPIIDEPGCLTESELSDIENRLIEIRAYYNVDVAVLIEENMSGETAMETADDYFDYGGYGTGENSDGILLYISINPRNYHFSTHGSAIISFDDDNLTDLESAVLPYLRNNDYFGALCAYADTAEELLEIEAFSNSPLMNVLTTLLIAFVVALIIAFIMTLIKLAQTKTAVNQAYASDYMKPGSMKLAQSQDIFLYSTVTKREKPKQNSSTHTSSSGETHGGRGGSY